MREILFKAKRLDNGEWVEGSCVNVSNIHFYIFTGKLDISNGYLDFEKYSVNPETVCQFTGLYDKNGNKIWENDVIEIPSEDENFKLEWGDDAARFAMVGDGLTVDFDNYWSYETEVIGNVFDNPELLKGGNNE